MLLVDALYVNMGGAMGLLRYLVSSLQERNVDFFLLADARCGDEFDYLPYTLSMPATIRNRWKFYNEHKNSFTSVFCFGNIPAPIKMPCPVYTYFHNVNLLKIPSDFPLKRKVITWMKQKFISFLASNTDSWIVQTQNTENCLVKALPCKDKDIYQIPFYYIPECFNSQKNNIAGRTDYILVGNYTGTRGHDELLEAFYILRKNGMTPKLHLTVSDDHEFYKTIEGAKKDGIQIENHGIVPFEKLAYIYGQCKATVYPSVNESLGLGIIEAIEAGCDVIASDLPFTHAICNPSQTFKRRTPEDIADAIITYEKGTNPKSELTIQNYIDELIILISKS